MPGLQRKGDGRMAHDGSGFVKQHRSLYRLAAAAALALATAMVPACQSVPPQARLVEETRMAVAPHLDQLGARNWIVIADPAFPVLAGAGVDVVSVPLGTLDSFREVLDMLELQGALTPRVWVCNELAAVPEKRAPGVKRFRKELQRLLDGRFHYHLDSRLIDMQLEQAASTYRILYIKTTSHLPYSNIAIELDSGYWNSAAEEEVRARLQQLVPQPARLPSPSAEGNATPAPGAAHGETPAAEKTSSAAPEPPPLPPRAFLA